MPKFTETATIERETETEAPASVSSLPPEILQFMTDVSSTVTKLVEKVDKLEENRSNMRPMNPLNQPGAVNKLQIPKDGTPFMDPKRTRSMPTRNGARLTPNEAAVYPQRFRLGSRVTLNLEAERGQVRTEIVMKIFERRDHRGEPFSDTKEIKEFTPITWGEVVAKLPQMLCPSAPQEGFSCPGIVNAGGSCAECGWAPRISRVEFVDDRGQWVYKIHMPGISSGNGNGTVAREQAFFDYELDPA